MNSTTYNSSGNWQIEQQCPQCGAPVTLDEADRLFLCGYCRTKLYLASAGHFRYYLPPPPPGPEILFLPYWRLKGLAYRMADLEFQHRFVDTNILALDTAGPSTSLGLRPQVMKLRFVSAKTEGRFLAPGRLPREAAPRFDTDGHPTRLTDQSYIGETVSIIYTPVYLEGDFLYDAILRKLIPDWKKEYRDILLSLPDATPWQVRFVPTLCPHCGWDMDGERDALVMTCRNCDSAWSCNGEEFCPVPFCYLESPAEPFIYLPFWRLTARIEGVPMDSVADLIRLGNLPRVATPALEAAPVHFWSPAFKVNPALFVRWARQMTVFQPEGAAMAILPKVPAHPVTLPLSEAFETIPITMASIAANKRMFLAGLPDMRIRPGESRLVYHPFFLRQNELVHATMGLAVDRRALSLGGFL
ncbi:MAG: hypothetical protein HPY65_16265 [Syntrophaceae bacterium]|nr:hypothetical protein [Syntrophaceae bacterium]